MTKEEFDKKYIGNGIVVVNVPTRKSMKEFFKLTRMFGYSNKIIEDSILNKFHIYKDKTCLRICGESVLDLIVGKESCLDNNYYVVLFDGFISPKYLLEDGFKVVYRNGEERYILVKTGVLYDKFGNRVATIHSFDDNLNIHNKFKQFDIIKIYNREDELIWEREEKSERDFEIERIESEMRKLADDLQRLKEVE